MSKKHRKKEQQKKVEEKGGGLPLPTETISGRGKKTIAAGIGVLVLGFIVLSLTDAHGRNWASVLSPFLILGGYAVIAAGIFVPSESEAAVAAPAASPAPVQDAPSSPSQPH
jgi:hypothetical protein